MVDLKGNIDWEVDESIQNTVKGNDHASLPTEKMPEEQASESKGDGAETGIEFKEIICPHNNISTAAMLGGIFEGEQVNQEVQGNESGNFINVIYVITSIH